MTQRDRLTEEKGELKSWMTSTEICDYLHINPRTFRRWRSSGKAPDPEYTTRSGYGLWSPQQQQEMLRKRANIK